jgi:hypothetical protein
MFSQSYILSRSTYFIQRSRSSAGLRDFLPFRYIMTREILLRIPWSTDRLLKFRLFLIRLLIRAILNIPLDNFFMSALPSATSPSYLSTSNYPPSFKLSNSFLNFSFSSRVFPPDSFHKCFHWFSSVSWIEFCWMVIRCWNHSSRTERGWREPLLAQPPSYFEVAKFSKFLRITFCECSRKICCWYEESRFWSSHHK